MKITWTPRSEDAALTVMIFDLNNTGYMKSVRQVYHDVDQVVEHDESFAICYTEKAGRLSANIAKVVFSKSLFSYALECETGISRKSSA